MTASSERLRGRAKGGAIVVALASIALIVRGLLDFSPSLDIGHAPNIWPLVLGVLLGAFALRTALIVFRPARQRAAVPFCPSCSTVNDGGERVCAACGASLDG